MKNKEQKNESTLINQRDYLRLRARVLSFSTLYRSVGSSGCIRLKITYLSTDKLYIFQITPKNAIYLRTDPNGIKQSHYSSIFYPILRNKSFC